MQQQCDIVLLRFATIADPLAMTSLCVFPVQADPDLLLLCIVPDLCNWHTKVPCRFDSFSIVLDSALMDQKKLGLSIFYVELDF